MSNAGAPGAGSAAGAGAPGGGGPGQPPSEVLACSRLFKSYRSGDGSELEILRGVELSVRRGESVAVVGKSGAGKSTLLHILGALDRPSSGEVEIGGEPVSGMDPEQLAGIRNRRVGFVFQFHHLLKDFSALENVAMPAMIAGVPEHVAAARAGKILEQVGLGGRLDHRPWQLSGGEQQRVAVARALVNEPDVLLADEPSGNLDEHTSERLHDLLFELQNARGLSMVVVTHNRELAQRAHRTLRLEEGVLHEVERW